MSEQFCYNASIVYIIHVNWIWSRNIVKIILISIATESAIAIYLLKETIFLSTTYFYLPFSSYQFVVNKVTLFEKISVIEYKKNGVFFILNPLVLENSKAVPDFSYSIALTFLSQWSSHQTTRLFGECFRSFGCFIARDRIHSHHLIDSNWSRAGTRRHRLPLGPEATSQHLDTDHQPLMII